jgi:exopolyphosphatase / guanosine-5'-triphosphate,3'-diphosphate pyrophosphatase
MHHGEGSNIGQDEGNFAPPLSEPRSILCFRGKLCHDLRQTPLDIRCFRRSAAVPDDVTSVGEMKGPGREAGEHAVLPLANERGSQPERRYGARSGVYAALDLGTNNCRLLVARPAYEGFRVVDAFSRIVRLGEGLALNGALSETAIRRAIEALKICRDKMNTRNVTRARLIATEACRSAENGLEFIDRVEREAGLALEIVDRETEARLAAAGCASLADPKASDLVLFDIGGGSTEVVWLKGERFSNGSTRERIRAWVSLPYGVVTLADRHGGVDVSPHQYEAMVAEVGTAMSGFAAKAAHVVRSPGFHTLGTSGTVTTIAGVHLGLERYDRRRVDGIWMSRPDVDTVLDRIRGMSFAERAGNACIGADRADLVLAGCAIFEAIRRAFPSDRVRIADRGLREGMLTEMMGADGVWSRGDRWRN